MVNPFLERFAVREHRALDVPAMHEAAQHLIGEHDFTSFRAAHCQSKSPVRELRSIQVTESAGLVAVTVTANAFLYHMVRNIVGALRRVGFGQVDPEWMRVLLEAKNRHLAGRMAPAHGLYLEHVEYGSRFRLPDLADFLVPGGK
jgi:tRNA pseudouridine38-40 synthase